MTNILVTGASGYIGSIVCAELSRRDHKVVGVDRNAPATPTDNFYETPYHDDYQIQKILLNEKIETVIHIGATSLVGPSVKNPTQYYENNVVGTKILMDACVSQGIKKFIFASSAATYGDLDSGSLTEDTNETPCNPYGWSKRMTEIMLQDYYTAYGLSSISFRFFNVAGAGYGLGQTKNATHLIARIMENPKLKVFGDTYDTPDGTAVRDYVHVKDVARAHALAVDYLNNISNCVRLNLGSGKGTSVLDVIKAVDNQTDLNVKYNVEEPRTGDPAKLVANISKAKDVLGWEPDYGLDKIIHSAYNWYHNKDV